MAARNHFLISLLCVGAPMAAAPVASATSAAAAVSAGSATDASAAANSLTVAGKQAWTSSRASPALQSLGQAVTVTYEPASSTSVPPGSTITQVHAARDYRGNALVQSSLCTHDRRRCVDIVGRHINSWAFAGLPAGEPMVLVHRANDWHGSRPPLFIKGSVTVWFTPPAGVSPEERPEP